ncbi:MAG: hypothetical protein ACTHMS_15810 [Jatrophihabitans sp.]|uniref:hypothetical protein n=1 Tax=Jatrophihabitans sp. TaxID=1932789 RepID=UPI003F80CA9C
MSYIHITKTPDANLDDYHRVLDALGSAPIAGRRSHWVGEKAGALHIVDIWESRADADRFASERLFPAFEQARMRSAGTEIVDFEAAEETIDV